MQCFIIIKLL